MRKAEKGGWMRVIRCSPQTQIQGGGNMCTTASLCVAISVLSDKIKPATGNASEMSNFLSGVMEFAGGAHRRVSDQLTKGGGVSTQAGFHDITRLTGLDLDALGVHVKSCIVSEYTDGMDAPLSMTKALHGPLLYTPSYDIIPQNVIPDIITPLKWETVTASVLTSGHHSTAIFAGQNMAGFAAFDPLPGEFWYNLNSEELASFLRSCIPPNDIADITVMALK